MLSPESQETIPTPLVRVTYPDAINLHTVLNRAKIPYNRFADKDLLDVILGNKRARKKKPVEIPSSSGILNRFKPENNHLFRRSSSGLLLVSHLTENNIFS